MSFGQNAYQHRFYTAPKIRARHIQDFTLPRFDGQRMRSVSAFNTGPLEQTMKQSFLRIINNGVNSRLFTKNQLGYEGVKFQKDIIDRYCQNDYKKNSEMLQRFKKQAEQQRRIKRFQHSKNYSNNQSLYFSPQKQSRIQSLEKHTIALAPITTIKPKYSFDQFDSINNTSRGKDNNGMISDRMKDSAFTVAPNFLPYLKYNKVQQLNKNTTRSHVIEEQETQSQNEMSNFHDCVNDVGVNFNSNQYQRNQKNNHNMQRKGINKNLQIDKKSKSLKLQTQKQKNKLLQKKYQKVKKKLMEKSLILSNHQKLNQQRQIMQTQHIFQQKIENLSGMISNLCEKLRQNNNKIVDKADETMRYLSEKKQNKKQEKDKRNQTQINLLKTGRLKTQISRQIQPEQNDLQIYSKFNNKSQQINKPKVLYSFNRDPVNVRNDVLKLLKNRMDTQYYVVESLAQYPSKYKTEINQNNHRKNKTQPF